MMAYWAESQGQSPVYSKYCTVPGPNCTHMYHDRREATYLPSPPCDQREPSCWTVPGSRTGGVLHDYTNWTYPDLTAPAASHFPFGLDNPNKDHPQPQEMRGRERVGGGSRLGPEREYESWTLKEEGQRRLEPCSNSTSLSDSSYRELQAWAARYSHSLPRRRRMSGEMKDALQEAPESSRTLGRVTRTAPDANMAALQRTVLSSSARGPWDVAGQQKTMTYNPFPVCPPETTMEGENYQRMRFSQPPGYICPPAYDGQHNSSPVMQSHNTCSTEQQGNRTFYLKSTLPNESIYFDLQDKRREIKEMVTKEAPRKISALDSNVYEHQMQETDTLWKNQPLYSQPVKTHPKTEPNSHSSPREVQESKSTEGIYSNVIEGRKFKLNKKTGGATIFCLVSRIVGTTSETSKENVETTARSHCTTKANCEQSELTGITTGSMDDNDINRMTKLADEVDFSVQKQPRVPPREQTYPRKDGATCNDAIGLVESQPAAGHQVESQTGSNVANQSHFQSTTEEDGVGDVNPAVGPQAGQTLPVRYPLWREPGYTARMDMNSSLPCRGLVNNSPTEKCGHPIDIEVRRFEIKEDEKPEGCGGQLVIDTTSVLVRMTLIPSSQKEHVNYLFHPHTILLI
ncbi:hypothetical protein NHX12_029868 [Muraenolepis orangiensis]|uniref:Uncharacterized protein n=1 Tax=Muraenolepis orangiensis TaxID=630683 RepID=A0A9Q0IKH1_9TELE|nr:hypothetical protein NHX12_029868 [Muraenolepis orangiensis]